MKKSKNKKLKERAIHLNLLMELSNAAFSRYLVNKFYLHALCLKKNNEAVYNYITKNAHIWPSFIKADIINLLNHYDIWFMQFENFRSKKVFELNDPFVFYHLDEQSAFPKESAQRIKILYKELSR